VDDDDQQGLDYTCKLSKNYPIHRVSGPRIIMSDMVNKLWPTITEDILYFGADDLVMRTKNWDDIIREKFLSIPDKIALLYGKDGGESQHKPDFATHPIIHRKWAELFGYVTPPYFSCDYADTWLNDLAEGVNRKFQIPIFNEHMHFTLGKAPVDNTYARNRNKFMEENTPQIYYNTRAERESCIRQLKKYIESYE